MIALVRDAEEAETAVGSGVDRLVVRWNGSDAAVPGEAHLRLAGMAAVARGRCPVSLWCVTDPADLSAALSACDADEVWGPPGADLRTDVARWIVISPSAGRDAFDIALPGMAAGIVVDADDPSRRLLAGVSIQELEIQARTARRHDLKLRIAGAMEAPDVPRLLAFAPDALVFDDLLRRDGSVVGPLLPERIQTVSALLSAADCPPLSTEAAAGDQDSDRIFVRDWILPLHLGAYGHETTAQRVRFSVEAEVVRVSERASDMRDVVTYDFITDAIARATVEHVALVESIAEDVATLILAHSRVIAVDVTVEKLDLGPGSLGCRIRRHRTS